jgi:hypothetical protein
MQSSRRPPSDDIWQRLWDRIQRRIEQSGGLKGRPSAGGVTVDPHRSQGLSGGAAAPLEFDDG